MELMKLVTMGFELFDKLSEGMCTEGGEKTQRSNQSRKGEKIDTKRCDIQK